MYILRIIVFLLLPTALFSQEFHGRVFDSLSTVKGAKVINFSRNIKTYTDNEGYFTLKASVKDSIVFRSLFHIEQYHLVTENDLSETHVFELKKLINKLQTVTLINQKKIFNEKKKSAELKNQIAEDIKNYPEKYGLSPSGSRVLKGNIFEVVALVIKLFKNKKKFKEQPIEYANYLELKALFKKDNYFSTKMLKNEFNIEEDYHNLFFQYCEAQNIDTKLLDLENEFMLLDAFLKYSKEFNKIVSDFEKEKRE